jgi:chemotaxis protein methyltransferase CheR
MTLATADFDFVRAMVHRHSAIVLDPGKEYLVESRLTSVARGEGFATLAQFIAALRQTPVGPAQKKVIEAMTTNETSFFRDIHPFDALRKDVLPPLLTARAAQKRLRIWCGASSSGQEPYTIAMVLREILPIGWEARITATDISEEMLQRTRAGRYSQLEVNRGLPAPMLVRHFTKAGTEWTVKDELRSMIETQFVNLIEPWPPWQPFDVVFLRNVLIYFDVPTKRAILQKIRQHLRPDGWLFLGGAETTLGIDDSWQRVTAGKTVCYRPTG